MDRVRHWRRDAGAASRDGRPSRRNRADRLHRAGPSGRARGAGEAGPDLHPGPVPRTWDPALAHPRLRRRRGEPERQAVSGAREAELAKVAVGAPRPLNGPVILADYDPAWPALFEAQAARIREALGERVT